MRHAPLVADAGGERLLQGEGRVDPEGEERREEDHAEERVQGGELGDGGGVYHESEPRPARRDLRHGHAVDEGEVADHRKDHEAGEEARAAVGEAGDQGAVRDLGSARQERAVRDHDPGSEAQREEDLTVRPEPDRRIREHGEVGREVVADAVHGARQRDAADEQHGQQHERKRHGHEHDLADPLDAFLQYDVDDAPGEGHSDDEVPYRRTQLGRASRTPEHFVEKERLGAAAPGEGERMPEIYPRPCEDRRVVDHDPRAQAGRPPAEPFEPPADAAESSGRRLLHTLAEPHLEDEHRDAGREERREIRDQERPAAALVRDVRKPPYIPQADRRSDGRQDEGRPSRPAITRIVQRMTPWIPRGRKRDPRLFFNSRFDGFTYLHLLLGRFYTQSRDDPSFDRGCPHRNTARERSLVTVSGRKVISVRMPRSMKPTAYRGDWPERCRLTVQGRVRWCLYRAHRIPSNIIMSCTQ